PFDLALHRPAARRYTDRHPHRGTPHAIHPGPPRCHGMKILVADDDPDLLDLVAYALGQAGYLVVKASSGLEAIKRHDEESPDLVILDINMPGATGFEVCATLRARASTPIMMLTARGEEQDLVRSLELGADDYLTKP